MAKGSELLRGHAGGAGVAIVTVQIANSANEAKAIKLNKGAALVISGDWHPGPGDDDILKQAGAFIGDIGGPTAHYLNFSRAAGIPAIGGTGEASAILKPGQKIVVVGQAGFEVNPVTGKKRAYGAVYEWLPDSPGAAKPPPGKITLPPSVLEALAKLKKG